MAVIHLNEKEYEDQVLKAKGLTLVDFWATWCGPCVASLPHIQELYNKYHDKGFEVFCVADNDSSEDEWKNIEETLYLSSIPGLVDDVNNIRNTEKWENAKEYNPDEECRTYYSSRRITR